MLRLGPRLSDEQLEALGLDVTTYRGRLVNVRTRWLVSVLAFGVGVIAVATSARLRGRVVDLWLPTLIIPAVVVFFVGMHVIRLVRLADSARSDAVLVGWCLGGFEVSELLSDEDLSQVGRVNTAVVGLFASINGPEVSVDRRGATPWNPAESGHVAVGVDGRRRWLLISNSGEQIEQRLFRPFPTRRSRASPE